MEVINSKGIEKAVILLKILEDKRLLIVDKETAVRFFDKTELSMLAGFKANIKHQYFKTNFVAFSNDATFFSVITSSRKESRLYNAKTKKLITKVDRHQGEVSCVGIDPLNRYMFSSGDDGKTFAVDIKSGKLIFTLPVHVDTVNDIAFSKNGNWVATCSYDRKISIFSLVTMMPKEKLKGHAAPISKVRFLSKNRLLSFDKNSSAIVWNIHSGKVVERLQGIHDDVRQMVTTEDDKFLFLGTALGYVLLYDLDTYELLSPRYIKIASPISAMEFDDENNNLIIASEDGSIFIYNIYEGEDTLKKMLQNKEFENIQKEGEKNPILTYTELYKLSNNFWETTLEKATLALQQGNKDRAILLFKSFKNIPSKNRIMQRLIADYAEFGKFSKFAKEGKLSLAYGLANSFPIYKDSKIYLALEAKWKKTLSQAQKYILNPKTTAQAKEIFKPYRGISEKTKLIQELLSKGEVYKRFRAALGLKDFVLCFELIKQNQFLKEIPEYEVLMKYGDSLYIKAQQLVNNTDTRSAVKMLRVLSAFDDFKEDVKSLMDDIEVKQKFFAAIENNNIETAYNMMALREDLEDTPNGKILQNQWYIDQSTANEYAVNGDAQQIKKVLSPYMKISSKYAAIGTIFAWCYIVQLEDKARANANQADIENGIKNFILSFGLQDQIENFHLQFQEKYPSSKLNLEHLSKGSMNMWRPPMIVDSILD